MITLVENEHFRKCALRINNKDITSFTLEPNKNKRIEKGIFELKYREVESGLTLKYRKQFNWFKFHIELQDTQPRKHIYIHIGNFARNSDGCILLGNTIDLTPPDLTQGFIGESADNFKSFYLQFEKWMQENKRVFLLIE